MKLKEKCVLVRESKDPRGQEGACAEVSSHGQRWEIAEGMGGLGAVLSEPGKTQ